MHTGLSKHNGKESNFQATNQNIETLISTAYRHFVKGVGGGESKHGAVSSSIMLKQLDMIVFENIWLIWSLTAKSTLLRSVYLTTFSWAGLVL